METIENINVNETPAAEQETVETKMYSAEEVAKLVQAESDRRTNQALAKQKREYEKKLSLSSLDEQQRKDAEAQMMIEELQNKIAAYEVEKNRAELKSVLSSRNLDVRFADIINITDDLEASQQNIDALDRLFKAAVKAEVEKRLAATGGAPKGNTMTGGMEITKESFKAMSLHQQGELYRTNPELYKKLTN